MKPKAERLQQLTFTGPQIVALSERFSVPESMGVQILSLDRPVREKVNGQLAGILSLSNVIENQQDYFPHSNIESLPGFISKEITAGLNSDKPADEKVEDVYNFTLALSRFGTACQRIREINKRKPALKRYDHYADYFNRGGQALSALQSALNRHAISFSFQNEFRLLNSELLNRISDQAINTINQAYQGQETDTDLLRQSGDALHRAITLNEKIAYDFTNDAPVRTGAREMAIRQNLALVKNDLLGYHSDSPYKTATDTAWHINHQIG